jgi:tetratricopeptide (TPR) repeat protein
VATGAVLAGAAALGGGLWWKEDAVSAESLELAEIRRTLLQGTPDQESAATTRLKSFLATHPKSADGWGLYAVAEYFQPRGPGPDASVVRNQRMTAAARRALALDPRQPDARTALASLASFTGRWTAAYRTIAPVYRDDPDRFFVNNYLASLFSQTGNAALSLRHTERALAAEKLAPPMWMLKAQALENLGRLAEAQAAIEEAYNIWPKQYAVWFTRLYLLGFNGRTAEALSMIASPSDWPIGISPDNQAFTRSQIVALGDRRPAAVEEALRRTRAMAPKGTGFAENAIVFMAALGMNDETFALADRYYFDANFIAGPARFSEEQRVYNRTRMTSFLFRRSMIGTWRDPRFEALVGRIGLTHFWRDTGFAPEFRDLS